MLPLLFLLLSAQAFAENDFMARLLNATRKSHSPYPMNYNDNIYPGDVIKPNTNFIFNFEQIRRDQPPQIEQREENIGLYMNRKPVTTTPEPTTTKLPSFAVYNSVNKNQPTDHFAVHSQPEHYYNPGWNQPPVPSVSTSSTPSWQELSDSLNHQSFPYFPSKTWNVVREDNLVQQNYQPQQQVFPSRTESHWTQPIIIQDTTKVPPTTAQQIVEPSTTNQKPQMQFQQGINRGSYKFNWNDLTTSAPQPIIASSTPVSAHTESRGPPPSVPTLTPWHGDNFGK